MKRCKVCNEPTKNTLKQNGQLCNRCFNRLPENRATNHVEGKK